MKNKMTEEKEITVASVIEWCDRQVQEGFEIKLVWDGGGDSGWCHFQIDDKEANGPEIDWLIDQMDNLLDYGSWAGEFHASGEAFYDSKTKVFEGEDFYSQDDDAEVESKFIIVVPSKFNNFEVLSIRTESDDCETEVNLAIRNGIKHPDKDEWEESFAKIFQDSVPDIIEKHYCGDEEIISYWGNYVIPFDNFVKLENGDLQAIITNFSFTVCTGDATTKTIDLKEMLNEQTEEA